MWKLIIYCTLFSITLAGIIHDHQPQYQEYQHEPIQIETDHHHNVEHEHATSHQSFKMHHFHAVPVYVKKEDQHFLKHPVEISGVKHNLKVIHPETQHSSGHGLTLENHTEEHNNKLIDHYGGGGGGGGGGGHDFGQHEANIEHEQPSYGHYEESSHDVGGGDAASVVGHADFGGISGDDGGHEYQQFHHGHHE